MNRRAWSWALYDFANSAFATTVLSVVFNVYFVQRVAPDGLALFGATVPAASLWSYTVSASMLITFAFTPLLGALADHSGRKKGFLAAFWALGCAASAALFFVGPGDVGLAMTLFVAANVGFAGGNVFYNAFLPELAEPARLGRLSGLGWAAGYAGGGFCLALNLAMIKSPASFGLSPENFLPVRASLLSVGLWWLVFGLPMAIWLDDRSTGPAWPRGALRLAFERLAGTLRGLRAHRAPFLFLAAYLLYNDGIETIILMASIFGAQALGMAQDELILCFLMIQGVALAGSLLFGWLADRLSHRAAIHLTLAVYVGVALWAYGMTTKREFWLLGVVVGLVLGGSQAASRSLMALLAPADKRAEFFAIYGLAGKLTAVLGPFVFGLVAQFYGLRAGILSLAAFFVLGGALLFAVREPGRSAA